MPLRRSTACPLSRTRPEANRPNRDRLSFRAARKVRRRVAESAAQSGSGRSARPTSVRVLMAFPQPRLDGALPFCPVAQSAAAICRLWCVSLPYAQLDTNLMSKRGSTLHHYQRQAFLEPHGYRTEASAKISAGGPTGGQIRQVTETYKPSSARTKKRKAPRLSVICHARKVVGAAAGRHSRCAVPLVHIKGESNCCGKNRQFCAVYGQQNHIRWTPSHSGIRTNHGQSFSSYSSAC
jgi:hypothetical protein